MNYRTIEGIYSVLTAMSKYTSLPAEQDFAIEILKKHHRLFQESFCKFYEEIMLFVNTEQKV